jgi:hypothetical protein
MRSVQFLSCKEEPEFANPFLCAATVTQGGRVLALVHREIFAMAESLSFAARSGCLAGAIGLPMTLSLPVTNKTI